jgi:succinate dehydrogenase / fumarate reductase cytochrome b subunit
MSSSALSYLKSAVWRKALMAATGICWMLFVALHMAGNIFVFWGPEAYNRYAHILVSNPLLPIAEASLVLFILLHASSGISLWIENRKAKAGGYAVSPKGEKAASVVARTMIFTGAATLAFLILHLANFKYGTKIFVTYDGVQVRDLYSLVAGAFQKTSYVAWYLVALTLVGVHLFHGFSAVFRTLGFYHPRYTPLLKVAGAVYALAVAGGFMALPIYFKFLA